MKTNVLYAAVLLGVGAVYFTLLSMQEGPESNILGEWKEVSWEYEKVDNLIDTGFEIQLTDHIKSQIAENLVIHEAEIWKFASDKTLEMQGDMLFKSLNWKLKGRGNILQIQGKDTLQEYYQIQKLDADRMELHFNFDLQVRGIVKITFERINA